MKRKIKWLILPVLVLLSACQLFLGPEPDISPSEILKSLWTDFNNIHANLDFRMSSNTKYNSWYDVYHNKQIGYARDPRIKSNMSEGDLFKVCAEMLEELKDPHVSLSAPGQGSRSYNPASSESINLEKVNGNAEYKNFIFGTFLSDSNIGYIRISEFINEDPETKDQEWGRVIDKIISGIANTKALVLDVRNNRGGELFVMEYIASRFTSEPKDYIKARLKTGPGPNDLSAPLIYTVKSIKKASNNKYGYTKPIVLLTNRNTVSAAEWFTMALRTQSHVTHMGTTTCGAFSARNDRFMINGWVYSISPERVTDMNDKIYEGIGIAPDIIERNSGQADHQLDAAFEYAKELAGIK
jgi:hypothetical protein